MFFRYYCNRRNNAILLLFQSPDIGGGWTYLNQIIYFLKAHRNEVILLSKKSEIDIKVQKLCLKENITVINYNQEINNISYNSSIYKFSWLKFIYAYLLQINYLQKIQIKYKASKIFIFSGWPFIWFKALYLPGRVIFTQHVMPLHPLDKGNKIMQKIALKLRKPQIVTVSHFAADKIKHFWTGYKYTNLKVVYNYYEPASFKVSKKQRPYIQILALARVEDGKNPLLWIEIAKEIITAYKNTRFIWAGNGSLLEEAIKQTENNPNIQFIGFINDVSSLYEQSDIYFEPSKREAHGISVVGAMCHSLPAIATNNGGTVESVQDGYNGFIVDVSNKEQMTDKLLQLIDNKELRLQMGKNGRERYMKLFTKEIWEKEMKKIIK